MAGLWCTALGWGEEALVEAAAEQMRKLSYAHIFAGRSHEPAIALAEKLKDVAPFPVGKVFFANSGSEANDTQIKLFWYANNARGETKAKKFISRTKAYHGVTLASASLTGLPATTRASTCRWILSASPIVRTITAMRSPARAKPQFVARLAEEPDRSHRDGRRRHHRRHDRRTRSGRGRRDRSAQRLFRCHRQSAGALRHSARRRRSDHGLRPHGKLVRRWDLRLRARDR